MKDGSSFDWSSLFEFLMVAAVAAGIVLVVFLLVHANNHADDRRVDKERIRVEACAEAPEEDVLNCINEGIR